MKLSVLAGVAAGVRPSNVCREPIEVIAHNCPFLHRSQRCRGPSRDISKDHGEKLSSIENILR